MSAVRGRGPTALFAGSFARVPGQGGLAWVALAWTLGLRRLGYRVVLVEPIAPADLRPAGAPLAESDNARDFLAVARDFGLGGSAAMLLSGTHETAGLSWERLRAEAREADLLIDVAGGLAGCALIDAIPARVYLDLDPGFTQLWQEAEGIDMGLGGHTHFVTVGLTFDRDGHRLPTCGVEWIPTPPPVLLEAWPFAGAIERDALTTVANWRGYGSLEVGGVRYGQKAHSLRPLLDLPRRTGERFALALAIDPGERRDLEALAERGWELLDPRLAAGTPEAYRRFVQGSRAELGVAKSGYVEGRCGWFSDRSVCYLASGRPVIAQETGFSEVLPVGAGLFAFTTADEVAAALEHLRSDYEGHRRAARSLAAEVFDSDVVLPRLLERVGVAA